MNNKYLIIISILIFGIGFVSGFKINSSPTQIKTQDSLYSVIDSIMISKEVEFQNQRKKSRLTQDSLSLLLQKKDSSLNVSNKKYKIKYEAAKNSSIDSVDLYIISKLNQITIPE
tara:strand:- start:9138 stop:9482 length:345 start_codon:yes stop_codon:yes gene_type:complete